MIVADASVVVDLLTGEGLASERLATETVAVPHLLDVEVVSAVRRQLAGGEIDRRTAAGALADLGDLELMRFPHLPLIGRAWELRDNVRITDGLYVALAEDLGAPLVTLDARLAASPGLRATIEVPGRR